MKNGENTTDDAVKPAEERVKPAKPRIFWLVQYWWILSILVGALTLTNILMQYRSQWFITYIDSEIVLALIGIYLPWVAAQLQKSTLALETPIDAILKATSGASSRGLMRRYQRTFQNPIQYLLAFLVALFGVGTTLYIRVPWTGTPRILMLAWIGLICALLGIVAYYFVIVLALIYRLARKSFNYEIFKSQSAEIKKIYKTYMGFFWMGASLYIAAVLGVWMSPRGSWVAMYTPLGRLWVFPVAVLAIAFFLTIQICIHAILAKIKEQRLLELEKLLAENYQAWEVAPTLAQATLIQGLVGWHSQVKQETDWPISVVSTITVIGSLLIPSISVVLDLVK